MKTKFWIPVVVLLCAWTTMALWSAHAVFVLGDATVYNEYGPIENLQVVVLAVACLLFAIPPVLRKGSERMIPVFLALLCFIFTIRELDIKNIDVHWAIKFIGTGIGRLVIVGGALLSVAGYAAAHFVRYKKASIEFLRSRSGILLLLGAGMILLGDLFEKCHSIRHNALFEETSELGGYSLILLSALSALSLGRWAVSCKTTTAGAE